jgi:hypothetical protein
VLNKWLGEDIGVTPKYRYMYWSANVYHTEQPNGTAILNGQRYYGEITPKALRSFQDTAGTVVAFAGDYDYDAPLGSLFPYESFGRDEILNFQSYLDSGGRFTLFNQKLATEAFNTHFIQNFQQDYLGALSRTTDTDYTNMDGNKVGTLSAFINDVNVTGGDGQNNALQSSEVDPNGLEAVTVFTWDTASGPGTSRPLTTSATSQMTPSAAPTSCASSSAGSAPRRTSPASRIRPTAPPASPSTRL